MPTLYVGLGANIGDKEAAINAALLTFGWRIGPMLGCSSLYATAPVGFSSPHQFLNAVAAFDTQLAPAELLRITQEVEKQLGRTVKSSVSGYADRTIDIDLLMLGDACLSDSQLTLPHPQMANRRFVLEPFAEIAPDVVHPSTGKTIKEMLNDLNGKCSIEQANQYSDQLLAGINKLLPQLSASASPLDKQGLLTIIASPATQVYVLHDELGMVCGMATLCFALSPTGKKAWVEDVVVDSQCRGRGYAKALLCRLEEAARSEGAKCLMLTSRPSRVEANKLYRKLGFELRKTNVYKKQL